MRAIRFQGNTFKYIMDVRGSKRNTKGWQNDPPAYIHPRILFGSGFILTPDFVKKHNITHVINCAFDIDCPAWFQTEFPSNYKCLNAEDDIKVNILDWYPEFERTMHSFLREEGSKNVYVHCQCGINRSGFLCLAFMCNRLSIDFNTAVKSILSQRPCALTNPSFFEIVYGFSGKK